MMTMDVGMYNNQQNGYGSAEYYQQGAAYQPPYEGYHEGYYEPPPHYYEPLLHGQPAHEPTTPVISTDTGLCYTNLDYGELQQTYPLHSLPPHAEPFKHREEVPRQEEMHMQEHKLDNHYLETKYNMHFVDEATMQYGHASPGPLPCEFEHYQPKEEFGLREGFPREGECGHHLPPGHQPHPSHATVPTYKWMQVKRNVPKPSVLTNPSCSSTLGVAHVAGMCKPDRSCSVNEDNGIMLAHTITHELGHNFGLYHDTEKIGCQRRDGQTLHIMTPIFEADTVQVAWSRCSKRDVTNFLDSGFGECLSDMPSLDEYVYPEVPAGVLFDAATQCHMQFGLEAKPCYTRPEELCMALWCTDKNTCKTMLRPAAPGTTCGPNMWCQNMTCVLKSPSPAPRDGGWGPWSEWSECSRSCGAGVSTQSRECNNPPPENNGAYCIGDRSRYKVCNMEPCPKNEPSFREVQCAKYMAQNNETIDDWIPYFDQDKPCDLVCVPRNGNGNDRLGGFVTDGTPCRQSVGSRDMCIAGVCYKVGCDWVVGSELEEDACGVCGGNGTACRTVQGIYNKDTTKQSGLSEVAVIPAGSRNVKIEEKVSPGNYISIGSAKSRKLYLTGTRNQTLTEYFVAGAQAIYERDRDWEKVRISGPLAEDIKVYQRIYRGRHRNPGVTYQYTVDQKRSAMGRRFSYKLSDWSPCNATCGVGYSKRELQCLDRNRVVELSRCYHIEPPRHEALLQRCRAACTHWWVGGWTPCQRCHNPGEVATKERSIYCVDKDSNQVVNDSECDPATKPRKTLKCNVPAC